MCRSDDENNEIYPKNYKSEVKGSVPAAAETVDGAWRKQYGFNSLLGVVFIISVYTGEVLDFEVRCKHYFECKFIVNGTKIVTGAKLLKSMKTNVP